MDAVQVQEGALERVPHQRPPSSIGIASVLDLPNRDVGYFTLANDAPHARKVRSRDQEDRTADAQLRTFAVLAS